MAETQHFSAITHEMSQAMAECATGWIKIFGAIHTASIGAARAASAGNPAAAVSEQIGALSAAASLAAAPSKPKI